MSELQKAADILKKAAEEIEKIGRGQASSGDHDDIMLPTVSGDQPAATGQPNNACYGNTNRTVASDGRRLFSPYAIPAQSVNRRNMKHQKWSHKFFCLDSPYQDVVPDKGAKKMLYYAGLGERKIFMTKSRDANLFRNVLFQSFPKLEGGGGFDLLRSISRTTLDLIDPPPNGYNSVFLSDDCPIGASIIYIRPIQKELDLSAVIDTCEPEDNCPTEECLDCGDKVPVIMLRKHIECHEVNDTVSECHPQNLPSKEQQLICKAQVEDGDSVSAIEPLKFGVCPLCQETLEQDYLELHAAECGVTTKKTFASILNDKQHAFESNVEQWNIVVIRKLFVKTALEQLEESSTDDWMKQLKINFIGEEGVYAGGLKREFFTLFFEKMPVFDNNVFRINSEFMEKQRYALMGKTTALAVIHGHPGPQCLSPVIGKYILKGHIPFEEELTPDDMPLCIQNAVKEIQESSSDNIDDVFEKHIDLLEEAGFRRKLNVENKSLAISALCLHNCLYKYMAPILQFMEGLKFQGILDVIQEFNTEGLNILTQVTKCETADEVFKLYRPSFSNQSAEKQVEEIVLYNFYKFLKRIECGTVSTPWLDFDSQDTFGNWVTLNMGHVLQALVGCRRIPQNMEQGIIDFDHDKQRLSCVNTCAPAITFSSTNLVMEYENFERHMISIITEAEGFGMA